MKKLLIGLLCLFAVSAYAETQVATFAGGCFWCLESEFASKPGVIEAVSGYAGGKRPDPTYKEVSSGQTGYVEAVRVVFNPAETSFESLLTVFFNAHDPTDPGGQGVDRGPQYRSYVFYHDVAQRDAAADKINALSQEQVFKKPIVTELKPVTTFYPAEDYHQDYYDRNPIVGKVRTFQKKQRLKDVKN